MVEFIHIKWVVRAEWHYRILHTFVVLCIQICTYSHTKQLCLGIWYFSSPKVANFIFRWCEYLSVEPVTFPRDVCHCLWMELSINWWLDRWFGEHWDLVRSGPHQLFLFSLSHRQEYRASHHDITIFHSTFWLWYWTVISFAMEFDLKMPSVRGCYSYSHGYHECQEEKNSLTKDDSFINN